MSEPENPPSQALAKDEGQHVPWRSKFRGKTEDQHSARLAELLSSNKNNPVKARIPNVFGMTTLRILGAVSTPSKVLKYTADGAPKTVPKTVAGLEEFFYDNWNVISQGYLGLAREEYVRLGLGYFLMDQVEEQGKGKRITDEGSRKK